MNNTKIAVIFSEKRDPYYYITKNTGFMEAFMRLPKNYTVEFFCYADKLNAYEKNGFTIWFKNTFKSLSWGINQYFQPNTVICIGSPNFEWNRFLTNEYRKIFIYDSYETPKKNFAWDEVIVQVEEDLIFFPKKKVFTCYNNHLYKKTNRPKLFNNYFPQKLENLDLINNLELLGINLAHSEHKKILASGVPTDKLNLELINSSETVCLVEPQDDIELALSSVACGVPVVASEDLKASYLDFVNVSLATTPHFNIEIAKSKTEVASHNLDNYTVESFIKKIKPLL